MSKIMKGLTNDYLQDVLVRLAHHSSAIEGNTISLADTVSIILHNTVPGKTNLRELYEVANHKEAFEYVLTNVIDGKELTTSRIKDIHELLMDRLLVDRGQFKKSDNAIKGADFDTASPGETPFLMEQWAGNLNFQLEKATTKNEILSIVGDFHIQFERVHPFSDGNGRTGRMLMNYSLLEKGMPPLIIKGNDKIEYVNILAKQDVEAFKDFAFDLISYEEQRVQKFANKEITQVKEARNISSDLEI
ncbi:hypothetical protein BTS2_3383 [Bacillus sp. TS-2]|nr:hypothetical protein BTS2_3383 [Bacillus sp. TS-2]